MKEYIEGTTKDWFRPQLRMVSISKAVLANLVEEITGDSVDPLTLCYMHDESQESKFVSLCYGPKKDWRDECMPNVMAHLR